MIQTIKSDTVLTTVPTAVIHETICCQTRLCDHGSLDQIVDSVFGLRVVSNVKFNNKKHEKNKMLHNSFNQNIHFVDIHFRKMLEFKTFIKFLFN